ncbi:hypothetical protein [Halococcus thailandensis]|uniref:hypothetical protein n=1 Tax=Halococcus thailandensis TaxID=335952 RepID=UPI001F4CF07E|nr:hypothetical protein [Halococcus thailandensis]
MVLRIRRALGNGVSKTLTKAGLVFIVLLGVGQIVLLASTNTLTEAFLAGLDLPAGATQSSSVPLSLPVSATAAGILAFVALLVFQVITVVLIRVMAADQQIITHESYTRRMGWVVLNSIAAGIIVGLLTMIGFVILVIPGLFLTVSLLFTTVYIADEDEGFISAIRDSWSLTSGNRWRLFGLFLVVMVLFMIVSFASGLAVPSGSPFSQVITAVLTTILVVYQMAVLTDAYRQLRNENGLRQRSDPSSDVTDM